jgi:hypothetical protein
LPRFRNSSLGKVRAAMLFSYDTGKFQDFPSKILSGHFNKLNYFPGLWGLKVERANSGIPLSQSAQNLLDRGSAL